jgi:hypothetical protein
MRRRPDPQQFRHAVLALARLRARQRVKDQIRAKGLKPQHYSARQIADLADEYVKGHLEELVTRATVDVAAWPEFAGANLETNAPTQTPPSSTASALQMSGAK